MLKVSTEMAFISLISELGYRENKMWTEDERLITIIGFYPIIITNNNITSREQPMLWR